MRTITVEKQLYTFAELSDDAKQNVKQWLDNFEFGAENVLEDFKSITDILGFYDVTPRYSGFWSQGDGASFTGRYKYAKGAAKRIREYAGQDAELHSIADQLQTLQARYFYKLHARIYERSSHYAHENTVDSELTIDGEGWLPDTVQKEFIAIARRLMVWLYRTLEREYDYCNSDDAVQETCETNGYEFDAKGVICHG